MTPPCTPLRRFDADQAGQATVEWSLLLAAFGIPMILVFALLLSMLAGFYQFVTFILMLPFP